MKKFLFLIITLVTVLVLTSASSEKIEEKIPFGIQIDQDIINHNGEHKDADDFLKLNVQSSVCEYCGGRGGFNGQPGVLHSFCNGTGRLSNNTKCTGCNGTGYLGAQCPICFKFQYPNTSSSSSGSSGNYGSSGGGSSDSGYVTCKSCNGSGKCGRCDKGWVTSSAYYTGGDKIVSKCGVCNGTDRCGTCRGTGKIRI